MQTRKKRKLTPFGIQIKIRLLENGLSQKDFCQQYNIREEHLSEIMYGVRKATYHRENIAKILNIEV